MPFGYRKVYVRKSFSSDSHTEKYHPTGNTTFDNLDIFQSLKLRILMEKNPSNFSSSKFHSRTSSCYGLIIYECDTNKDKEQFFDKNQGSVVSRVEMSM